MMHATLVHDSIECVAFCWCGRNPQAGCNALEVHVQGPDQVSQRLVDLAQQATSAVLPGEAADLWSTAFKALSAQQLPLDGLLACFIRVLSASAAGPLRVHISLAECFR